MSWTRKVGDERGQTMTEFAVVVPALLLVLFAVIQCAIVFNNYVALTDAVRVGARKGAVSRHAADPRGETIAKVRSAAADLRQADLQVDVTSLWNPGSDVRVTASYPYEISLFGLVVQTGRLSSVTTERVE